MDDTQLLELAYKAFMNGALLHEDKDMKKRWNPLVSDADALRLAVKLGLDVCIDAAIEREPNTHVVGFANDHSPRTIDDVEHHKDDPYAATRKVIVRVAAEIGKTK